MKIGLHGKGVSLMILRSIIMTLLEKMPLSSLFRKERRKERGERGEKGERERRERKERERETERV